MTDDDFLQMEDSCSKKEQLSEMAQADVPTNKKRPEPGVHSIGNSPNRSGDEDALDYADVNVQIVNFDVSLNFDEAESKEEEYQNLLLQGKSFSVFSKFFLGIFIFFVSLCGIFLLSNVVSFFAEVPTLPSLLRWVSTILMILFILCVVVLLSQIFFSIRNFKQAGDFNLSMIKSLAERDEFRNSANKDFTKIKTHLLDILTRYDSKKLRGFRIKEESIKIIDDNRKELIEKSESSITNHDWVEQYIKLFQKELNDRAKDRILMYSKQAGVTTAISPFPIIDQMIIISSTLAMIKDIFQIYNLRLSKVDNIKLFGLSIVNTYFSGISQQLGEKFYESFLDPEFAKQIGVSSIVGKFVAPKVTEGLINGFLIWRLGKYVLKKLNIK